MIRPAAGKCRIKITVTFGSKNRHISPAGKIERCHKTVVPKVSHAVFHKIHSIECRPLLKRLIVLDAPRLCFDDGLLPVFRHLVFFAALEIIKRVSRIVKASIHRTDRSLTSRVSARGYKIAPHGIPKLIGHKLFESAKSGSLFETLVFTELLRKNIGFIARHGIIVLGTCELCLNDTALIRHENLTDLASNRIVDISFLRIGIHPDSAISVIAYNAVLIHKKVFRHHITTACFDSLANHFSKAAHHRIRVFRHGYGMKNIKINQLIAYHVVIKSIATKFFAFNVNPLNSGNQVFVILEHRKVCVHITRRIHKVKALAVFRVNRARPNHLFCKIGNKLRNLFFRVTGIAHRLNRLKFLIRQLFCVHEFFVIRIKLCAGLNEIRDFAPDKAKALGLHLREFGIGIKIRHGIGLVYMFLRKRK